MITGGNIRKGFHVRLTAFLAACVLAMSYAVLFGMLTSFGAESTTVEQRLFDEAELLTEREKRAVKDSISSCRKKTGMDVAAVTAFNDGVRTAMQYADDYYDYHGFGTGKDMSGVLVLLYMDGPGQRGGECWISTSGNMIRILTDKRIDLILDDMYDYLWDQDYYGAMEAFARDIEYYVDKGIQKGQYNYDTETGEISVYRSIRWYEAAFAVIVSAFVAGSVCLGVKSQYSMKKSGRELANSLLAYQAVSKYQFANTNDILLNKYVTSAPIPRAKRSGGAGGGSSGRSSTHHSSSGHSHGGGGRRF